MFKALAAAMDPLNGPRASLDALRAQQATLGPVDGPLIFARAVSGVLPIFPPDEGSALLAEADGLIDAGLAADPRRASELLTARGELHLAANDRPGAEAALRALAASFSSPSPSRSPTSAPAPSGPSVTSVTIESWLSYVRAEKALAPRSLVRQSRGGSSPRPATAGRGGRESAGVT